MTSNFKYIHIGKMLESAVLESGIEESRICKFLNCNSSEISKMYLSPSIDSHLLLRWSKLLEYDFFRVYTQHLILFAPPQKGKRNKINKVKLSLPNFKKNIYTEEIINFLLELIANGEKSKKDIVEQYGIPKTTLYKWITKREKI